MIFTKRIGLQAILVVACGALFVASNALAQTSGATKTTRIIVAFPPGGPVDFVARSMSEQLSKELGHQVIVENKAGANGAIAAEFVSRSAPDASVLWLTSVGAVAINPALYEKLSAGAARTVRDNFGAPGCISRMEDAYDEAIRLHIPPAAAPGGCTKVGV